MDIPFFLIDAFTDTPFQGNPAGVFFDFDGVLTAERMRRMAGEVSLESAFVLPVREGREADFRLRYFTGVTEVPLCGHDTVAAAVALIRAGHAAPGSAIRFINNVGALPVRTHVSATDGVAVTLMQTPQAMHEPLAVSDRENVARVLGLETNAFHPKLPLQVVSTGTPWLYAPVVSPAAVESLVPADFAAITRLSERLGTFGVYVFALEDSYKAEPLRVRSRCFAPIAGIDEDPVTGSASGGLGWYLTERKVALGAGILSQQGAAHGRQGTARIQTLVDSNDGAVTRVDVTGTAVIVAEGVFRGRSSG